MQQERYIGKYIGIKTEKGMFLKIFKTVLVNLNLKTRVLICLPTLQEYHTSGNCLLVSEIPQ